LSEFSK
jgi:hypothetical protein